MVIAAAQERGFANNDIFGISFELSISRPDDSYGWRVGTCEAVPLTYFPIRQGMARKSLRYTRTADEEASRARHSDQRTLRSPKPCRRT